MTEVFCTFYASPNKHQIKKMCIQHISLCLFCITKVLAKTPKQDSFHSSSCSTLMSCPIHLHHVYFYFVDNVRFIQELVSFSLFSTEKEQEPSKQLPHKLQGGNLIIFSCRMDQCSSQGRNYLSARRNQHLLITKTNSMGPL